MKSYPTFSQFHAKLIEIDESRSPEDIHTFLRQLEHRASQVKLLLRAAHSHTRLEDTIVEAGRCKRKWGNTDSYLLCICCEQAASDPKCEHRLSATLVRGESEKCSRLKVHCLLIFRVEDFLPFLSIPGQELNNTLSSFEMPVLHSAIDFIQSS